MTPLRVEILLWYYSRANDYRDGDFDAPAVREAIDSFRTADALIAPNPGGKGTYAAYRLTSRGRAYVEAVLAIPLPDMAWRVPAQRERLSLDASLNGAGATTLSGRAP